MHYDSNDVEDEVQDADTDHYYSYYEDMLLTEAVESSATNIERAPVNVVTPLSAEDLPYFRENVLTFSLRMANIIIDDLIVELAVEELASEQALVVQEAQPEPEPAPEPEPEPEPFDPVAALNCLPRCVFSFAAHIDDSAAASSHAQARARPRPQGRPPSQGKEAFGAVTSRDYAI